MLSKTQVADLITKIKPELEALGTKLGWKLTVGRGTYGDVFTFKVEAAPIRADGSCESKEVAAFRTHAHRLGLKATDFGQRFTAQDGRAYVISGLNPRCIKLPVLAMRVSDGKTYKFAAETVRCLLVKAVIVPPPIGSRTTDDILRDLRGVESELSPENLFCDGEISNTEAKRREKALLARRSTLVKELGREPTAAEIWGF